MGVTTTMTEYVPTTEEVREAYASTGGGLDFKDVWYDRFNRFDRWLAAHDAEVEAKALREAGEAFDGDDDIWEPDIKRFLNECADRKENGAGDDDAR